MASPTTKVIRKARRKYKLKVYTRKNWLCPNPFIYQTRRVTRHHQQIPDRPTDTVWQHITVTNPQGGIRADMRLLHKIGMERFGTGVSYNWAVRMDTGAIGLGQAIDAAGAHTLNDKGVPGYSFNQNYVSIAIAVIGMPGQKPSKECINSIAKLIAAHIDCGFVRKGHDYNPHSMVAYKDCPTQAMRDVLDEINEKALKWAD